jgi:FixJ family two-component response regulator
MSEATLICIVDDDASMRAAIKNFVESAGFSADAFASAEELLASDAVDQAACLVADVQMPGLSGLALYERLSTIGKPIPTVLITAYPNDRMRGRALKAGVVCYLAKPFSDSDLLACIRSALGQGQNSPCAGGNDPATDGQSRTCPRALGREERLEDTVAIAL